MASARPAVDRVTALFALPGEEFVAARDALAKEFKANGDKEVAAAVKALRRPTVAASAVNWLARDAPKDLAALVRLGERLREAHRTLADGGDSADIRKVTADRRRRTAALTDRAVANLGPGGEAQRTAIANTLDAAVNDAESGTLVLSGQLSKELDAPAGFGAEMAFTAVTLEEPRARPPREDRRAARRARRDPVEASAVDAALEVRRRALRREADIAVKTAQEAAREATSARTEVARRQHELVEAEAALRVAEERARLIQWKSVAAQNDLRRASE